jgi:hypothetical protein
VPGQPVHTHRHTKPEVSKLIADCRADNFDALLVEVRRRGGFVGCGRSSKRPPQAHGRLKLAGSACKVRPFPAFVCFCE